MIRRSGCHRARGITILVLVLALTSSARAMDEKGARDHFEIKVRPILVEHCYPCHSVEAARSKGGLKLDSRDGLRVGGDSGPAVTPGKPDESLHLLGIDHEKLTVRHDGIDRRLTDVHGKVMRDVIA